MSPSETALLNQIVSALQDGISGCLQIGSEIGSLNTSTPPTQLQLIDLTAARNRVLADIRTGLDAAGALLNP